MILRGQKRTADGGAQQTCGPAGGSLERYLCIYIYIGARRLARAAHAYVQGICIYIPAARLGQVACAHVTYAHAHRYPAMYM